MSGLSGSPGTVFLVRAVQKDQKAFALALVGRKYSDTINCRQKIFFEIIWRQIFLA